MNPRDREELWDMIKAHEAERKRLRESLTDIRAKMREIKYQKGKPRGLMLRIADDVEVRITEALKGE